MRLTLPWQDYDMEGIRAFFQDLEGRVEALPMVASASVTTQFPPLVFLDSQFSVEGEEDVEGGSLPQAYLSVVSPGYFRTTGMTMIAGRALDERDRDGSPEVAVINQTAARRFFGGENPVGRRFKIGGPAGDGSWIAVVGLVADTRNRGLDVDPQPEIFGSSLQVGGGNQFFLIARTEGDPRSALTAIRGVVASLDPDQPIYAIRTVQEAYAASVADRQLAMVALSLFAAFALLLASMGIYAVVAFGVAERTGEIGLRMALGADAGGVRRMIVRQALAPVLVGAVVGLGLAFGIRGFLQSLLFQVSDTDPLTFGAVTAFLLVTALIASYAPARRASRLNPVDALREE
jgi:putative ABC transport system permease protein